MLVKMIKNVVEKIKFKFKGTQNQDFVFESNISVIMEVDYCRNFLQTDINSCYSYLSIKAVLRDS